MIKYKLLPRSTDIAVYDGKTLIRTLTGTPLPKRVLRRLCRTCTRLRLAPEQLNDVLEDALYSFLF